MAKYYCIHAIHDAVDDSNGGGGDITCHNAAANWTEVLTRYDPANSYIGGGERTLVKTDGVHQLQITQTMRDKGIVKSMSGTVGQRFSLSLYKTNMRVHTFVIVTQEFLMGTTVTSEQDGLPRAVEIWPVKYDGFTTVIAPFQVWAVPPPGFKHVREGGLAGYRTLAMMVPATWNSSLTDVLTETTWPLLSIIDEHGTGTTYTPEIKLPGIDPMNPLHFVSDDAPMIPTNVFVGLYDPDPHASATWFLDASVTTTWAEVIGTVPDPATTTPLPTTTTDPTTTTSTAATGPAPTVTTNTSALTNLAQNPTVNTTATQTTSQTTTTTPVANTTTTSTANQTAVTDAASGSSAVPLVMAGTAILALLLGKKKREEE